MQIISSAILVLVRQFLIIECDVERYRTDMWKPLQGPASSDDEERLIIDKFRTYNHLIRPADVVNVSTVIVDFGLAMILLINVDEKNQIMQTNVWLTMKWKDFQMEWVPKQYGNITTIRVPPDKVWLPDIVLFNNADGNYEVSFHSNVVVDFTGTMLWVPPAIYKSSCTINVEYFPFDEQKCLMDFRSWTYNSKEVQLNWYNGKKHIELNDYSYSGIWDVIDVPGQLTHENSRLIFDVKIRRKTLFYTVILIIPTVLMAFLSMMVFYLPADASEKITLAISILLALVVFLLLVSKILPPTSITIPLMAKYLLLTFIMNIITILVTVIIINVYFRGPTTHRMPKWVKVWFLERLPSLLLMTRPRPAPLLFPADDKEKRASVGQSMMMPVRCLVPNHPYCWPEGDDDDDNDNVATVDYNTALAGHHPNCRLNCSVQQQQSLDDQRLTTALSRRNQGYRSATSRYPMTRAATDNTPQETLHLSTTVLHTNHGLDADTRRAIEALDYITRHLKRHDDNKKIKENWKFMAMVLDRLLLYIFFGVTLGGTLTILLSAPNVFEYVDQKEVIDRIRAQYPNN